MKGSGSIPGVPDTYDDDDDNDDDVDKDDEDDDANNQDDEIPLDNDGDDFVHPKLSTHDDEARQDDEVNEEESDEEVQGVNIKEEEEMDAPLPNVQGTQVTEDTHVIITAPINPEGQHHSSCMSSGFVSNMLNPSSDTCIDTIFTLNTKATSSVDVLVTTIAEPPLLSATTLPPTPLITHLNILQYTTQ
ncbi:hypothetical protein Tco_1144888 [Tanacetum coccineum]